MFIIYKITDRGATLKAMYHNEERAVERACDLLKEGDTNMMLVMCQNYVRHQFIRKSK
jgi:hypothetical protein